MWVCSFCARKATDSEGRIHHRSFTLTSRTKISTSDVMVTSTAKVADRNNGLSTFGESIPKHSLELSKTKSGFLNMQKGHQARRLKFHFRADRQKMQVGVSGLIIMIGRHQPATFA